MDETFTLRGILTVLVPVLLVVCVIAITALKAWFSTKIDRLRRSEAELRDRLADSVLAIDALHEEAMKLEEKLDMLEGVLRRYQEGRANLQGKCEKHEPILVLRIHSRE